MEACFLLYGRDIRCAWPVQNRALRKVAATPQDRNNRTRQHKNNLDPRLFRQQPPARSRERLAVSSFRRRRRSAPPSPLSPLGALSHISQSLTDAPPGCPRTSALIKARLIDINRQRGHATAQQLRKTAEKPPAEAGKVLLPAGAPNGTSRRSPRRTPSRASCAGAFWVSLLQPGAPATNARRLEPAGGGRQVVSRPSGAADGRGAARRWAELPAGRPPRGSGPDTGREGVRTGPPRHLASVACSPGRPSAPHAAQGGWGGAEDRAAARQGGIWGRRRVLLRGSRAGGRNYGWSGRPWPLGDR